MDSFRPRNRAESKGLLLMSMTRNITARTLIWLTAILVPVQGLPAASCGCTGGKRCCEEEQSQSCCCSAEKVWEGTCCCARLRAEASQSCCCKSHCGQESSCTCGINCQCGKTKQQEPATPPAENNQAEKVASDSLTTSCVATVYQPQTTQQRQDTSAALDAIASLDRCASLCRFTL